MALTPEEDAADCLASYNAAIAVIGEQVKAGAPVPAFLQSRTLGLRLPGSRTRTSLSLPTDLSHTEWVACGQLLAELEGAVQWWIGDWWAFGATRQWGASEEAAKQIGVNPETAMTYGSVARAFQFSMRVENLSFFHHRLAMAAPAEDRQYWLDKATREHLSSNQLRAEINRAKNRVGALPSGDTCRVDDLETLIAAGQQFATIYADPPWPYDNQVTRAATSNHYGGMSIDEIATLPVEQLAAPNAHLHLWTTNGFFFEALRVMEAWGFEYKSCFVWVKPGIGNGNYWRLAHEFMLLGVRGSLPFENKGLISWGEYERGKHSSKPEKIRDLIEKASPGPRLELFARSVAPDWTVWGNGIERNLFFSTAEEIR